MLIWSLLSPGRWRMKSCWVKCKTLNLIFSKTNFRSNEVYVLSSICKTLHNFSTGLFPMYCRILELKKNTNILRKNGSFSNKTCCDMTALFLKTKIYFCRCNFVNKQTNKKNHSIVFLYWLWSICRTQNISENFFSFGNGTPKWVPTKNVAIQ